MEEMITAYSCLSGKVKDGDSNLSRERGRRRGWVGGRGARKSWKLSCELFNSAAIRGIANGKNGIWVFLFHRQGQGR